METSIQFTLTSKQTGILAVTISALLYGFSPILSQWSYDCGSNALTLTFYRSLIAAGLLFLFIRYKGLSLHITRRHFKHILWVSGCIGFTTLLLNISYASIGVGAATTLHFLYPVFVILLSFLLFHEKIGWQKVLALVLSCSGTFCFLGGQIQGNLTGIFFAVMSGLLYAAYMVGMEHTPLANENQIVLAFYFALFVSGIMFFCHLVPVGPRIIFLLPSKALALTAGVAVCSSVFAVILLQIGILRIGASNASIYCLFEPISCIFFGVLLLNEAVSVAELLGSCLILLGIFIISWQPRSHTRQKKTRSRFPRSTRSPNVHTTMQ